MSAPKGKLLERPGAGQYLFQFPDRGFFACRRCHAKVAAAKNKVAAEGGYCAFAAYTACNLRCDLVVRSEMTTIAVACRSCLCNVGFLHPLHGHLMAQSASLVHCPLERRGPEWDKEDTIFSEAVASASSSSSSTKQSPSPKKGNSSGAQRKDASDGNDDDVDEDSDADLMQEADRDSVLFG